MVDFRADLHIHTVLSPCGDLDMSPRNIIRRAVEQKLDIIGIADHNSTLNGPVIRRLGASNGIYVLTGVEICTKEEVHSLAFFKSDLHLKHFQNYLDENLIKIPNNPEKFGHQVVVDEYDNITATEDNLLISAINKGLEEVEKMVHELGGIFIPAHVNKSANSLLSQLGFLPSGVLVDGFEISRHITKDEFLKKYPAYGGISIIQSSDAHYVSDIGSIITVLRMESITFKEIKMALAGKNGREVIV